MDTPRIDSMKSMDDADAMIVTPGSMDKEYDGPRVEVKDPHENDVLCGRGGSINSHAGNERFRQLVEKRKRVYLTARFKREKRLIANSILSEIRSLDPPGRFLARDSKKAIWYDIGDEKARDKTSQALRENAPSIRAEIEVEINHQRAEMQRVEDEEAARSTHPASVPPHAGYYQQPWGYYAPFYHGYGQYHPEPPPSYSHPNAHPNAHPNTHHTTHTSNQHPERYEQEWHGRYDEREHAHVSPRPPAPVQSRAGNTSPHSQYDGGRSHPHSAAHPTAPLETHPGGYDVSAYVPSSIAAWTRNSLSFGAHSTISEVSNLGPKPAPPIHKAHSRDHGESSDGRRAVHFREDSATPHPHRHHSYNYNQRRSHHQGNNVDFYSYSSPTSSHSGNPPSVTPDNPNMKVPNMKNAGKRNYHAIEPVTFHNGEQSSSLLSQVANHILGSWDASMVCANNSTEEPLMVTDHRHSRTPTGHVGQAPVSLADAMEDDEEGQEVPLDGMMMDYDADDDIIAVDDNDDIRDARDDRLPDRMPGQGNMGPPPPRRIEIDWPSRMLGCQRNWLPETFNQDDSMDNTFHKNKTQISPANSLDLMDGYFDKKILFPSPSLDMDTSAMGTEATEGVSCNESVGGISLVQVFSHLDNEGQEESKEPDSPVGISQVSSWEGSVRSNTHRPMSPHSQSDHEDNYSLL